MNKSKGAIGCSLSHITLWNKLLNSKNNKHILILEDDVIISKNFWKKYNEIIKEIPNNFDIVYLGASNINGKQISKNIVIPTDFHKDNTYNTGMYAILINKKCLKKLINNHLPITDAIDQTMKKKLFDKLNIYYVVSPTCFT